jgi:hypothetical protein
LRTEERSRCCLSSTRAPNAEGWIYGRAEADYLIDVGLYLAARVNLPFLARLLRRRGPLPTLRATAAWAPRARQYPEARPIAVDFTHPEMMAPLVPRTPLAQ